MGHVPSCEDGFCPRNRLVVLKDTAHALITAFNTASTDVVLTTALARSDVRCRRTILAANLCPREGGVAGHLPDGFDTVIVGPVWFVELPGLTANARHVVNKHRHRLAVLLLYGILDVGGHRHRRVVIDGVTAEVHEARGLEER